MSALLAILGAAALLATAVQAAPFWSTAGGGRMRSGVWPPSIIKGNVNLDKQQKEAVPLSEPVLSSGSAPVARLGSLPFPVYENVKVRNIVCEEGCLQPVCAPKQLSLCSSAPHSALLPLSPLSSPLGF